MEGITGGGKSQGKEAAAKEMGLVEALRVRGYDDQADKVEAFRAQEAAARSRRKKRRKAQRRSRRRNR